MYTIIEQMLSSWGYVFGTISQFSHFVGSSGLS